MLKEIINFSCLNFLKEHISYLIFAPAIRTKSVDESTVSLGRREKRKVRLLFLSAKMK